MDFTLIAEYKKFLGEGKILASLKYDEMDDSMKLFRMRYLIKSAIFNNGSNNSVKFDNIEDERSFLIDLKEFNDKKNKSLPSFIFDEYNAENFRKCVEYKMAGHSLLETEDYYISEIKAQKNY